MDDAARIGRTGGIAGRIAGYAALLLLGVAGRKRRPPVPPHDEEPRNDDTRVEPSDAPPWVIGFLAALAVFVIAAVIVALLVIFPDATRDQPKALTAAMPEPRLQTDPAADMRAYRAEAERTLHSYGWVDRAAGIARIPIDEAMRRVAERGIPDWPEAK
ncbi:hypothetical protein [Azospirillum sp. sgz301742]